MSNNNCNFAIWLAYDAKLDEITTLIQEGAIITMSVVTTVLGVYAFLNVIIKHELYRTKLLLAYYIVIFLLLAFRLTTYFMISLN
jgi:fatty-acid desaturase